MTSWEDQLAGKRVLVTGASGFIGQWLCRRLFATRANVFRTSRRGGKETLVADLTNLDQLEEVLRASAPQIVFHAAAYGIDHEERSPELHEALNATLPKHLCELLARFPEGDPVRLVHIGSGAEYGNPKEDLTEDSEEQPASLYGVSKLAGSRAVLAASEQGQISGVVARLFTVYGSGEHSGRLLPSIMEAARSGRPVLLTGGQQQRDFTYVEDCVEGLIRLALAPAAAGAIVNVATGQLTSVREFAETAAAVLGFDVKLLHFGALPGRKDETVHPPVCTNRMRKLAGWTPETGIREGIMRTVGLCAYA